MSSHLNKNMVKAKLLDLSEVFDIIEVIRMPPWYIMHVSGTAPWRQRQTTPEISEVDLDARLTSRLPDSYAMATKG